MKLIIALVLALCANAAAADHVIHVNRGRLVLWPTNIVKPMRLELADSRWDWEGRATNGEIVYRNGSLCIHVDVDIVGPYWDRVDIVQDRFGITVSEVHSSGEWSEAWWYASYAEMKRAEGRQARFATELLRRCNGGNPIFCDDTLRAIASRQGKPESVADLVGRLDADEWTIRRDAQRSLSEEACLPSLVLVERQYLSDEQNAAIGVILGRWQFDFPSRFLEEIQ